jgi:uncharacterized membrane protein
MSILSMLDWYALSWFLICWAGYTLFANRQSKKQASLSTMLTELRGMWMGAMIKRDMRIADATALGILQRTVTFFASTTIFILAGLLAVLGASDKAIQLAKSLPFISEHSQAAWEIKIILLIWMYVYAFFKFSWSVRQYNFSLVMLGAAPERDDKNCKNFIIQSNRLLTSANNSFNFGLRAYTFSMAILAWLVHPYLFMLCSTWVVAVLYRREFNSRTLAAMQKAFDE